MSDGGSTPKGCDDPVIVRLEPIAQLGDLTSFDKTPTDTVAPIGMCPDGRRGDSTSMID